MEGRAGLVFRASVGAKRKPAKERMFHHLLLFGPYPCDGPRVLPRGLIGRAVPVVVASTRSMRDDPPVVGRTEFEQHAHGFDLNRPGGMFRGGWVGSLGRRSTRHPEEHSIGRDFYTLPFNLRLRPAAFYSQRPTRDHPSVPFPIASKTRCCAACPASKAGDSPACPPPRRARWTTES